MWREHSVAIYLLVREVKLSRLELGLLKLAIDRLLANLKSCIILLLYGRNAGVRGVNLDRHELRGADRIKRFNCRVVHHRVL